MNFSWKATIPFRYGSVLIQIGKACLQKESMKILPYSPGIHQKWKSSMLIDPSYLWFDTAVGLIRKEYHNLQLVLKNFDCVLEPVVTVKDRNCIRILFHSKPGSAENQEIVVPPEYNSVVFQIQDDIYIQLFTVVAPKSRDICQPFFIDVFCYKLSVQNISAVIFGIFVCSWEVLRIATFVPKACIIRHTLFVVW